MRLSWRWWRRRTPGRHELGAAVTDLPAGAMRSVSAPPAAVRSYAAPPVAAANRVPAAAAPATVIPSSAALPAHLGRSAGPMVSLGFRDGSTATLDPGSLQARALQQLANSLTTTD